MIHIGIAGCGWAGERHYDAVLADGRARVTAIADADAETLERRAAEWDLDDTFDDYVEMYERGDLDAVVVALPHDLHEDAVIEAARAGLSILCEKPIARTVAEADRMIDAARDHDVSLVVAESARYEPWVRRVEEYLADGVIGHPVFTTYNWLNDFGSYEYERAHWLNDADRLGGGQWHLNGVHIVSAIRGWFSAAGVGDVTSVFAQEYSSADFDAPSGIEGNVHATLVFPGGESADISLGLEVHDHERFTDTRIVGTDGAIRIPADRSVVEVSTDADEEPRTRTVSNTNAFEVQMGAFISTIMNETRPPTPGVQERDTLEVIEAGYRSIADGTAVDIAHRNSR